jgi:hypothetical protein
MNIDSKLKHAKDIDKKRRRRGPIDIIIAEDSNRRSSLDSIGETRRRPVHIAKARRVRQQITKLWVKKLVDCHIAKITPSENPADGQRYVGKLLGNGGGVAIQFITLPDGWRGLPPRIGQ